MSLLEELNKMVGQGIEFPDAMMNMSSKNKLSQEQYDELMNEYDDQCVNHAIPQKKNEVERLVEKALAEGMKISVVSEEGTEVLKSTDYKEVIDMIDDLEESGLEFYKDKNYLGSIYIVDNEINDFSNLPVINQLANQIKNDNN